MSHFLKRNRKNKVKKANQNLHLNPKTKFELDATRKFHYI